MHRIGGQAHRWTRLVCKLWLVLRELESWELRELGELGELGGGGEGEGEGGESEDQEWRGGVMRKRIWDRCRYRHKQAHSDTEREMVLAAMCIVSARRL